MTRRELEHLMTGLEAQRLLEQLLAEVQGPTDRERLLADLSRAKLGQGLAEADPHRDPADPADSPVQAWRAEVQRIVAELEQRPLPAEVPQVAEPWCAEG